MIKKLIAIIASLIVFGGAIFFLWRLLKPLRVEIEIRSTPKAAVFINGKHLGDTPYQGKNLKPGLIEIKLVPVGLEGVEWERKIDLPPQTHLLITRQFAQNLLSTEGDILYLEKTGDNNKASLMITSIPQGVSVTIDGEMRGFTPLTLEDIGSGEHKFSFSAPSYKGREILAKGANGYRLVIEVSLAKEEEKITEETTQEGTNKEEEIEMVEIGQTSVGWLRVREGPSKATKELAKVKPGEKFKLLAEEKNWFKIEYEEGKEGWIFADYAKKVQQEETMAE